MRVLPNILAVVWALLILGSLFLTYMMPVGTDPVTPFWAARVASTRIHSGMAAATASRYWVAAGDGPPEAQC